MWQNEDIYCLTSMKDNAWIPLFCITQVTMISEKDKARIMNTLLKVKLLILVGQLADLLRWNFLCALFFR